MKIFFLLLFPFIIKCCIPAFHETEKSYMKNGNLNRLYINPKRPYEGYYEKRRMKERGFISEESILFPVLKVFETNNKTNNTYSYFVKINERDRNSNQNFKMNNSSFKRKIKKYPIQLYQVLETYANNPYKFRYMYLFEEIMNEKEEINNEKYNQINNIVYNSYEKEDKKIVKMEILFQSKWLFNWKIYVIRVFLEDNKEESFAIVDGKEGEEDNNMEIAHCLGSDRMEINLELLD